MPTVTAGIRLKVTKGKLQGREFTITNPARLIIGWAADCSLRLPSDDDYSAVSRHHCLLAVSPPALWVQDLGLAMQIEKH